MHAFVRTAVTRVPFFDSLFIKADDLMGYGKQVLRDTPIVSGTKGDVKALLGDLLLLIIILPEGCFSQQVQPFVP
jgi:hypothetical protein